MKINWGTGIVIAFVAFISFILFFVFKMVTDDNANHALVRSDYYEQELVYQDQIDAEKRANKLSYPIEVKRLDEGLLIVFPTDQEPSKIEGTISLYRPSNTSLDLNIPIKTDQSELLISNETLVAGRWDISIEWTYEGITYLYKSALKF